MRIIKIFFLALLALSLPNISRADTTTADGFGDTFAGDATKGAAVDGLKDFAKRNPETVVAGGAVGAVILVRTGKIIYDDVNAITPKFFGAGYNKNSYPYFHKL